MSRIRMSHTAVVAVALALFSAAPARAQFGGLVKKAKQAIQIPVTKDSQAAGNTGTRPSEAFGEPLTESSLAATLRGLDAEGSAFKRYDALRAQEAAANTQRDALSSAHQVDGNAYTKERSANDDCRREAQGPINKRHEAEMQTKMMDPAVMRQLGAAAQEDQAAQTKARQSGDTAASRKSTEKYLAALARATGGDPHADSVALDKQCGKSPAKPAYMIQEDSLANVAKDASNKARAIEGQITSTGAGAAGMPVKNYALARERVFNWVYEVCKDGSRPPQKYPDAERKMLEAHRTEIMLGKRALGSGCR